ncbi:hypothetical protein [Noviherbaspirillum autotrophicum]|uniref:hypothetical protein n=1 Tax=Noviherbaspirillum autotrophicum TaxID=709839 RepID=UPI000694F695|nr:hypothetical protein [Noviherbaspirillum autotrophicum]
MKSKTVRVTQIVPIALAGMLATAYAQAAEAPVQPQEQELLQPHTKSGSHTGELQENLVRAEQRGPTTDHASLQPEAALPHPGIQLAQAASAPAAPRSTATESARSGSRTGPGTFEVDEEAAQRALERTLTQSGALLLPQRTVEVTPSYTYRRSEQSVAVLANIINPVTSVSTQAVINQRSRQNENTLRVDVRAGLPYSSQLEFSLPYSIMRTSQVTDFGTGTSANGKGIGDVALGIAKTLTRESGARPDLVGRFTYNFGNGKRQDDGVPLNGGYRQMTAELIALKRQDPLAFVASAFYSKTFEKDGIRPGDTAGISLSANLAASPATSLQFGFSQVYRKKQENNGITLEGTDQTYGIATIGASSVLSRDLTLVTQLGIGMGNDAPKYSFTISLPILFR